MHVLTTSACSLLTEHASHVTMSVVKLLSRIVLPDEVLMEVDQERQDDAEIRQTLHGE
jgi:hypothetical protein